MGARRLVLVIILAASVVDACKAYDAARIGGTGPGGDASKCLESPIEHGTSATLQVEHEGITSVTANVEPAANVTSHLSVKPVERVLRKGSGSEYVIELQSLERDGPARSEQFKVRFEVLYRDDHNREIRDVIDCVFTVVHTALAAASASTSVGTAAPSSAPPTASAIASASTPATTQAPTARPTPAPTAPPTQAPTVPPTPALTAPPTAAPTAPPTPAPTAPPSLTGNYGSYNAIAQLVQELCYSPYAASFAISGNADGTGLTITFRPDHPSTAVTRTYRGTLSANGTLTATSSGSLQSDAPSAFTGTMTGTISGGRITATERISHNACGPSVTETFNITGSK